MGLIKSAVLALATLAIFSCGQTDRGESSSQRDRSVGQSAPLSQISGSWSLDPAASKIAFASIKSGEIGETHHFGGLSGGVNEDGSAIVSIALDEVETKIDQRNERMRTLFFETETYPVATVRANIDKDKFSGLEVGERLATEVEGSLSLHGIETDIYADVFVTRISEQRVEVATSEPVIVYVSDFSLEAGLEALRGVAALPSITPAVPVTFTFVFEVASAE